MLYNIKTKTIYQGYIIQRFLLCYNLNVINKIIFQ